jgi:hypothetical protein
MMTTAAPCAGRGGRCARPRGAREGRCGQGAWLRRCRSRIVRPPPRLRPTARSVAPSCIVSETLARGDFACRPACAPRAGGMSAARQAPACSGSPTVRAAPADGSLPERGARGSPRTSPRGAACMHAESSAATERDARALPAGTSGGSAGVAAARGRQPAARAPAAHGTTRCAPGGGGRSAERRRPTRPRPDGRKRNAARRPWDRRSKGRAAGPAHSRVSRLGARVARTSWPTAAGSVAPVSSGRHPLL